MASQLRQRELKPGVYAPVVTIFGADEELDLINYAKHVTRLGQAGIGLVLNGSYSEAIALTNQERAILIKTARDALDGAGLTSTPIIAGVGVGSTRESIQLAREAHTAGADAVIVIPPAFIARALNADQAALLAYFSDIAAGSPLPVMAYSYPAATGINLTAELLTAFATRSPNSCGVKYTCNDIAKLSRVASITASPQFAQTSPRSNPLAPFLNLAGMSDALLPSLIARGSGAITGLANIAPHAVKHLFDVSVRAIGSGDAATYKEAQRLQDIISRAETVQQRFGIAGAKVALQNYHAYGGAPRRPLPSFKAEHSTELLQGLAEVMALEAELAKAS